MEKYFETMEKSLNKVQLRGTIISLIGTFEHRGEEFLKVLIKCNRKSDKFDLLKIVYKKDLGFTKGDYVEIEGRIKTRNVKINGLEDKSVLEIFVHCDSIKKCEDVEDLNRVELEGFICRPITNRMTPMNKEITEMMLATNETYNRSYYIPTIAFFGLAEKAKELKVGDKVKVIGRFQSREYKKMNDDKIRMAYELVISEFEKLEEN